MPHTRLWAIADLHLGFSTGKWMDKFGERWKDHPQRIEAAWRDRVAPGDIVVLPGDFSWAMKPEEAAQEFRWLAALPGRKVLIKGNHDYWWPDTKRKMQALLPPETWALKRNALVLDGLPIVGVRGCDLVLGPEADAAEFEKTKERELHELRLSIEHLKSLVGASRPPLALFHYPPFAPGERGSVFTPLIEALGCSCAVYGHLHGLEDWGRYFQGESNGVAYHLVSADYLNFEPKLLQTWDD